MERNKVKDALRDLKIIKQAAQRNVLPKVKGLLLQSVFNQGKQDLSAQQVRSILGVQIPKVGQGDDGTMQGQGIADRDIKRQNNQQPDMNMSDIAARRQTPEGVIVKKAQQGVERPVRMDQAAPVEPTAASDKVTMDASTIERGKDQMTNQINRSQDMTSPTGDKKRQISAGLRDNPTQNIPTSTQQNVRRKMKEKQDMQNQNKDQWIKQSLQALGQVNIFQNVGDAQNTGRPTNLDIIPQTFTDSDTLQVMGDQARDHIQQPSAVDVGATNDYESRVKTPSSYRTDTKPDPMKRVRRNTPGDRSRSQVDKSELLQMLGDLNDYNTPTQDTTHAPAGKQVITQQDPSVRQRARRLDRIKLQNARLSTQVKRLRMISEFIVNNASSLNQSKIKQLAAVLRGKKNTINMKQGTEFKNPEKKLFQSNVSKFKQIREGMLNNRTTSRATDPESDRMRQLAGLQD